MAATTESKKTSKKTPGLRVTSKRDGFRRGGREWSGSTELALDALSKDQLAQIRAEPLLIVEDIELDAPETEGQD